jgi:hypothetical protein
MAESVEGVGEFVAVAKAAIQGEGLLIIENGLAVLSGVVGDVTQAVQGSRLAVGVMVAAVQGERGLTVSDRSGVRR